MTSPTTSAASSSPAVPPEPATWTGRRGRIAGADGLADRFAPPLAFVGADRALGSGVPRVRDADVPAAGAERDRAGVLRLPAAVWLGHIWATFRVALMGYLVAIVVSIPLAVGAASSRLLSRTLYPILVVVQSTPIVAVAPIIVVTLGASDLPRVVITFLITFFPIVVSTDDRPAGDAGGTDRAVALAARRPGARDAAHPPAVRGAVHFQRAEDLDDARGHRRRGGRVRRRRARPRLSSSCSRRRSSRSRRPSPRSSCWSR